MGTYNVAEIGRRIKNRRSELKMTLEDVALKVNVTRSTIQRYEAGIISRPKLPVIHSIAQALDVSPDWLMGLDVPMERNDPAGSIPDEAALDASLIRKLTQLSPEQLARVEAYIEGLTAGR